MNSAFHTFSQQESHCGIGIPCPWPIGYIQIVGDWPYEVRNSPFSLVTPRFMRLMKGNRRVKAKEMVFNQQKGRRKENSLSLEGRRFGSFSFSWYRSFPYLGIFGYQINRSTWDFVGLIEPSLYRRKAVGRYGYLSSTPKPVSSQPV